MDTESLILGGVIGTFLGAIIIGSLVFYVLTVIAGWKILTKAGESGWKSLIPIYNVYMFYKISNCTNNFWLTVVLSLVSAIVSGIFGYDALVSNIVTIITGIGIIYLGIVYCSKLSKAFGKGTGFTVGLILLPNIFQLILGFGDSKYIGE